MIDNHREPRHYWEITHHKQGLLAHGWFSPKHFVEIMKEHIQTPSAYPGPKGLPWVYPRALKPLKEAVNMAKKNEAKKHCKHSDRTEMDQAIIDYVEIICILARRMEADENLPYGISTPAVEGLQDLSVRLQEVWDQIKAQALKQELRDEEN